MGFTWGTATNVSIAVKLTTNWDVMSDYGSGIDPLCRYYFHSFILGAVHSMTMNFC